MVAIPQIDVPPSDLPPFENGDRLARSQVCEVDGINLLITHPALESQSDECLKAFYH